MINKTPVVHTKTTQVSSPLWGGAGRGPCSASPWRQLAAMGGGRTARGRGTKPVQCSGQCSRVLGSFVAGAECNAVSGLEGTSAERVPRGRGGVAGGDVGDVGGGESKAETLVGAL